MATPSVLPAPLDKKVITNPSRQKIDVSKALKLRLQGNTLDEIGAIFDCSGSAVHQALNRFEPFLRGIESGTLTAYSEQRAELFNTVEQHLSASLLDPDAMTKASLNNRAYALKVIHEARRLETNQSTNNVSVLSKFITDAESTLGTPTGSGRAVAVESHAVQAIENTAMTDHAPKSGAGLKKRKAVKAKPEAAGDGA